MNLPLASTLDFLFRSGVRHANDASVARELNVVRRPLELPRGLSLRWLGAAGFAIEYEGHTILVDPYVCAPAYGRSSAR